MRVNKLFEDRESEQLRKQIYEVSSYISQELDKRIVKQLILRVLEKNLVPILSYPTKEQLPMMPMWYSSGERQINIHTPVPRLDLLSDVDFVNLNLGSDSDFYKLRDSMKEAVIKLE